MAKKKKARTLSGGSGLAKKFLSMKYMGIGTTMSPEEFEELDRTIDVLEENALEALRDAEWRKNEHNDDSIIIGEEIQEKEGEEG